MDDFKGQIVDNYEILEELGRGGMGMVYKARDVQLDKIVALKMIAPKLIEEGDFLERFRNEAKMLAKLSSPHIVQVFAFGQSRPFIVMEFVEGMNLSGWAKANPNISLPKKLSIFKDILNGLNHAHGHGVIHRDIKPQNILISNAGEIKVTDFGLAKLLQPENITNATHTIAAGTPIYMSPEQMEGLKNIDHRGDVYSCGITFYEILVEKLPLSNVSVPFLILRAILNKEYPSPIETDSSIPQVISDMIMKAIEPDPKDRFQSVKEMIDVIENFEKGTPGPAIESKPAPAAPEAMTVPTSPPTPEPVSPPDSDADVAETGSDWKYTPPYEVSESKEPETPAAADTGADDSVAAPAAEKSSGAGRGILIAAIVLVMAAAGFFVYQNMAAPEDVPAVIAPAFATLSIQSDPPDAEVYLNGERVGITNFQKNDLKSGRYDILVKLDGHQTWRKESIDVQPGEDYSYMAVLENNVASEQKTEGASTPPERPTTPPVKAVANATLQLSSVPGAAIHVDNEMKSANAQTPVDVMVTAGNHMVKFEHPEYGAAEFPVSVAANAKKTLTCYFETEFTIVAKTESGDMRPAAVLINGEITEYRTPTTISLGPGAHTISVRRSGYINIDGEKQVNPKAGTTPVKASLVFTLKK